MAIEAAGSSDVDPSAREGIGRPERPDGADASPHRVLWAPREGFELGPDVSEDLPRYRDWAATRQAARLARRAAGRHAAAAVPEICLLLMVERPHPPNLRRTLRSIAAQTSPDWRLVVTMAEPVDPIVKEVVAEEVVRLPAGRTDVRHCSEDLALPDAARAGLEASPSPALMVLGSGDELAPDAVALLGEGLLTADVVYGDEDRIDEEGAAFDPALKPDWSPELALGWNYVGHPVAFRRAPVEAAGGVRSLAGGDWEHDLLLRVTEVSPRVGHVAEVLLHRHHEEPRCATRGDRAVANSLARRRETATIVPGPLPGAWHIGWRTNRRPSVTVVVPFRDAPRLLRECVDSISATSSDVDLDLILVDNGSEELETLTLLDRLVERPDVTIVHDPRPFNWAALNNGAASSARGEVLVFLNNDIEALRTGWLGALSAQALRRQIGAAGARLLFPSGRLQHAGVVLGMAGPGGHVLVGMAGDRPGYLGMAILARDCAAVTGACLATRAKVFEQLEGFDESLGLDLNDVDYCLRARRRGLHIVYEPAAELVHHESPSRGTSGSVPDQIRFLDRWEDTVVRGDPFLSPHLTRVDCSAGLRGADEEGWWRRWRANLTM